MNLKISNYSIVQNTNNIQKKFLKSLNSLERTPNNDIISFSGKKVHKKALKPYIQSSIDFSQELLKELDSKQITIDDIAKIVTKYVPDTETYELSELKKQIPNAENYDAFFYSQMGSDFKPKTLEMYLPLPPENADNTEKLLFATSCAHEFTHNQQMILNKPFQELKTLSKNDYEYAKFIMGIGDAIFEKFDTELQAKMLLPIIEKNIDIAQFAKYGKIVPKEASVNRQMLLKTGNFTTDKEMRDCFRNYFDDFFDEVIYILSTKQTETLNAIPKNEDLNWVKKKVLSYCVTRAIDEKEAYTTESEVAKKMLNIDGSLNIDVFPMYYDMLAKAFS